MYEKIQTYQRVPTMGTSLPSSPQNGDQFLLVDSMSAPTYSWLFQYVAAKASNKWVFVGGAGLLSEVTTAEATTSATYAALTTAGPSVAIPVAGIYQVALGCKIGVSTTGLTGTMSYDIGGTGAVDEDSITITSDNVTEIFNIARKRNKTLTAVTLTAKYKTSAPTSTFVDRWLEVLPIAIGG